MRMYVQSERWHSVQPAMNAVFGWMAAALAVSGGVAYYVAQSPALSRAILGNSWVFIILAIAQLVLVVALTTMIYRMRPSTALVGLLVYSILNGCTLSVIFSLYTLPSLATAFVITSCMFITMALYGYVTKSDLSAWGNLLFMALIGIIIAMAVNIFLKNSYMDFIISCAAVVIFTLLIAYDTQKIKTLLMQVPEEYHIQMSVVGALMLYLDFINLLLNMLRLMGNRRQE